MVKAFALMIVGAIILAGGIWYSSDIGHTVMSMVAALIMAAGGAIITWGIAVALDVHSPTSRKL
ncbi:hypothetical protein [Corynebacterium pacaense]|uniref:hypothetical protein n=1 Tax=Corynebacterium pacaense TaxID=1816684 RepID=UPI0009BB6207|nr:hypothetical protein [Corynebacterium pacaense]